MLDFYLGGAEVHKDGENLRKLMLECISVKIGKRYVSARFCRVACKNNAISWMAWW